MIAEAAPAERAAVVPAARILIVEDERIVARILQKLLIAQGYEVVASVSSGMEAIEKADLLRPDIVLMDISLDGPMDGVEAAAAIRTRFRLPVVFLTAYSSSDILERAKKTEPFGYILKPYQERELHVVIETSLYKHGMARRERELEEQLHQVAKLKAVSQIAGGVAHAFNNLMTSVLGHSDIMLKGMNPDDPFFANVEEIWRAAARTASLTQKLSAYSRIQIMTLGPLDLNSVVTGLAPLIRHMQSGVRLDLALEPGLGLTVSNRDQIEEAIITLVRNACAAMPSGGLVTIRTASKKLGTEYTRVHLEVEPGPYLELVVSDTGAGMSPEAISHLFEPFNTRKASAGAGMGLAALYGFVKQCGGDVEVRSEIGQGTTFHLYFPKSSEGSNVDKLKSESNRSDLLTGDSPLATRGPPCE